MKLLAALAIGYVLGAASMVALLIEWKEWWRDFRRS